MCLYVHIYRTRAEFALIRKKQTAMRTEARGSTGIEEIRVAGTREAIDKAASGRTKRQDRAQSGKSENLSSCTSFTQLLLRGSIAPHFVRRKQA
jgi:hypothetical protein